MTHGDEVVGQRSEAVLEVAEGGARAQVVEVRPVPEDKLNVQTVRVPQ